MNAVLCEIFVGEKSRYRYDAKSNLTSSNKEVIHIIHIVQINENYI